MNTELIKAQKALRRMLNSKKMDHPEVIIIYAETGGIAQMTGAHWNEAGWSYSKWTQMPEHDLNGFLQVFLEANYTVVDARLQANMKRPGMGDATPVMIVRPDVNPSKAVQAVAQLHQAILDSEELP